MSNNYVVLARKYRSQTFADLIGQSVLSTTLSNAIASGKIAHGYVFSGIRGTGKTSTARIFAKALNCTAQDGPTSSPCGECDNCRAIAAGQHMDVMEIDAASHTGVDNIRDILDSAGYAPNLGRYKIYIIDEAHMLSKAAFNALLKTLEEPPAHVVFMMATTEIRNIPMTILSRCQRFDLARVHMDELKSHFLKIANSENVELSEPAATLIAHAADGSVRDGLSILDQAISQTNGKVDEDAINGMLKRTGFDALATLMESIMAGDAQGALARVADIYSGGADLSGLLADMQDFTYWLTRAKIAPASLSAAPYTENIKSRMKELSANTAMNTLSRMWQVMTAAAQEISNALHQKNGFDMMMIRMMYLADIKPIKALLAEQPSAVTPAKAGVHCSEAVAAGDSKLKIESIQDLIGALTKSKETLLLGEMKSNVEITDFAIGRIKIFDRANAATAQKLRAWLDANAEGKWIVETAEESAGAGTIAECDRGAAASDPLVNKALGMFGGEISKVQDS
ncbi:MAG: DNA polymerase III subunit gamma/tau [Rickettsiales bacterium]|jgi:DNA polymerase-3 subunit gamma/tau|nr:DNA polymerase III subunit gamma/tau [Rickettsiales bacterium]